MQNTAEQNEKDKSIDKINLLDTYYSSSSFNHRSSQSISQSISQSKNQIQRSSPQHIKFYNQFMGDLLNDPSLSNFVLFVQNYSQQLIKNKIRFVGESKFQIKLKYASNCLKVVVYEVYIAFFVVEIEIYNHFDQNFDQIVKSKGQQLGKGSEGQIFKIPFIQGVMKRTPIVSSASSSQSPLNYSLFQYAINKLVSALKIGPKVLKPFMFDIICSRNYIYFFIEECFRIQDYHKFKVNSRQKFTYQGLKMSLKKSLCLLHKVQVIHYDIKPQNIMYSPYYDKLVFIDFGLAESKAFAQGWKQIETFKGTYFYSSDEMKDILIKGKGFVDAYYNDSFSLNKALEVMKDLQCFHPERRQQYEQSYFNMPTDNNNQMKRFSLGQQIYGEYKSKKVDIDIKSKIETNSMLNNNQKNDKHNNFKQNFLQSHITIYVSYLVYHNFEQQLINFFDKKEGQLFRNDNSLEKYLGMFFQFGNAIKETRVFQLFIQRFLVNNVSVVQFPEICLGLLNHEQGFQQKDLYHGQQTKSNSQHQQKNNKQQLTPQIESVLTKYPFLLILKQKYIEANNIYHKAFKQTFCIYNDSIQQRATILTIQQIVVVNDDTHNQLSKFYYFGQENSRSQQYIKNNPMILRYYLLADYVAYLYHALIEFGQDLKDQYRVRHFYCSVGMFFDNLGKYYQFFKQNQQQMSSSQTNDQEKLTIIKSSLSIFYNIITQAVYGQNKHDLSVVDASLSRQISKFNMVCMKLQRIDLAQQLASTQLKLAQKILFCSYSRVVQFLQSIVQVDDCFDNNSEGINKYMINQSQKKYMINQSQTELIISICVQKFFYTLQKKCVKLIGVYYNQNQYLMTQTKQQNKLFLEKFNKFQQILQKSIDQLKSKLNLQGVNNNNESFTRIKLFVQSKLSKLYQNEQIIDTILFFKKFQSFLSLNLQQSTSFKQEVQRKFSDICQFVSYLNRKYGQKLALSFLIYDEHMIGQIFFQQAYKSFIIKGCLFKAMKMIEQHLRQKRQKYRNEIQVYWQTLVRYYQDLFSICDILGYYNKMYRISKIVSKLIRRDFNSVSQNIHMNNSNNNNNNSRWQYQNYNQQQDTKTFNEMRRVRTKPFRRYLKQQYKPLHQKYNDLDKLIEEINQSTSIIADKKQLIKSLQSTIYSWLSQQILLQRALLLMQQQQQQQYSGIVILLRLIHCYIESWNSVIKLLELLQLIVGQLLKYGYDYNHLLKTFQNIYIMSSVKLIMSSVKWLTHRFQNKYQQRQLQQRSISYPKQSITSRQQQCFRENLILQCFRENLILQFLAITYQRLKSSTYQRLKSSMKSTNYNYDHNQNQQQNQSQRITKSQIIVAWLFAHSIITNVIHNNSPNKQFNLSYNNVCFNKEEQIASFNKEEQITILYVVLKTVRLISLYLERQHVQNNTNDRKHNRTQQYQQQQQQYQQKLQECTHTKQQQSQYNNVSKQSYNTNNSNPCTVCVNNYMQGLKNNQFFFIQGQQNNIHNNIYNNNNIKLWRLLISLTQQRYLTNINKVHSRLLELLNIKQNKQNIKQHRQDIGHNQNVINPHQISQQGKYIHYYGNNQHKYIGQLKYHHNMSRKIQWLNILQMRSIHNHKFTQANQYHNNKKKSSIKCSNSNQILRKIKTYLQNCNNQSSNCFSYSVKTKSIIITRMMSKVHRRVN